MRRVESIRQSDIVDVTMIRGPGGDPAGGGDRAPITSTACRCGIEGWLVILRGG
jgi:hypothetical protein